MTLLGASAMPASQIVNPTIDVAGQFQQGRQDAAVNTSNDLANQVHQIEMLASGAAHAMPQGPNGPVDPAKWNEVLDTFEQTGMDPQKVAQLREHPEVAAVVLKGSANALKAQQDAATFEQQKQLLDAQIAQALSATAKNNAPPETTRVLTTDEVAKLGLPAGSYQQGSDGKIAQIGGGGQTINVGPNGETFGSPGEGLVWQRDKDNKVVLDERGAPIAIPYKGGKAYRDQTAADEAGAAKEDRQNLKANVVVQDIDRALSGIADDPFWTTGVGAQMTGWAGGSPAKNVEKLINTVKSNSGFQELQAMRDSSPTGGALGNITEKEITYLQSTIGSLDQDQSPEQLVDNLKRVKNAYLDIIHGEGNGPPREELGFEGGKTADKPNENVEAEQTIDGVKYVKRGGKWFEAD
jgi:hypothetical protein